jgi:hypothetical protein
MAASHTVTGDATSESALARLQAFLAGRRRTREPTEDFERFERELHAMFAAAEREALAEELAKFDVDVPVVEVEGVAHRRVVRCEETYFTSAGAIRVERTLYSTRQDGDRAICPLELRAGVVEGLWTPHAARLATWVVAHLTPQEGEELFTRFGGMTPSKSSLDRLPKQWSERWEAERQRFEAALRSQEIVPAEATTVGLSLDGVMAPMKDGLRKQKRERAAAEGKQTRGPAGYQEVGCATVSTYDAEGERLRTVRMGRMPEKKKASLKTALIDEAMAVIAARPDLRVVCIADGTKDNWPELSLKFPQGTFVVDFYHAADKLHAALQTAYGETSATCAVQFEKLRRVLKDHDDGVEKVIRALVYLRDRYPRRKKIGEALKYFRRNRHRMKYAELHAKNLPIGSGVVEAACKTLVTQRMKRSGMRWRHEGGQAVLTLRALVQSDRFDRAWNLIGATYKQTVTVPENVVALSDWRRR